MTGNRTDRLCLAAIVLATFANLIAIAALARWSPRDVSTLIHPHARGAAMKTKPHVKRRIDELSDGTVREYARDESGNFVEVSPASPQSPDPDPDPEKEPGDGENEPTGEPPQSEDPPGPAEQGS